MTQKIVFRFEHSVEIDIRIFSGDSSIRHGGIWNCGSTSPLIFSPELDIRNERVSLKRRPCYTEEKSSGKRTGDWLGQ